MLEALHRAGHKYLKLLFVLALAGSSALFFIGSAVPKPPAMLIIILGGALGVALEWSYFVVSCDLTLSVTERNIGGMIRDGLYTVVGALASWFMFTNAALHVGWAPADDLLGLSRQTWAMIMAGLVVAVIFMLSARSKPPKSNTDLQAMARAIGIMLPEASDNVRLRLLATIASEAAKHSEQPATRPAIEAPSTPADILKLPEEQPEEQPATNGHNGHQIARSLFRRRQK